MARYKNFKKRSRKQRFTQVEKTAFLMGQVQRGLNNPDSRISASYERGIKEPTKRPRKTLF